MSECNLDRLVRAGIVPQEFKEIADFLKALDELSDEEVEQLIKLREKTGTFQMTSKGGITPSWC
ncbi:MAG: hypothetical protein AAGM22_17790 [Acidobacteriota bacterium]